MPTVAIYNGLVCLVGVTMKLRNLFLILLAVLLLAVAACSQSRTNRLTRPCPSTSTLARVEIQSDGDIDLVPCSGGSILLNGSPLTGAFTVSGASRTNFFPYFDSSTDLAKSPFGWDGTKYAFNLNAGSNDAFRMELTPKTDDTGRFRVGDFTNGDAYIDVNENTGNTVTIAGDNINLTSPSGQISFGVSGSPLLLFPSTITAGGTTGNQTINKPRGTVNFAAAVSTLTVTNSTVTANSIVFCVIRTNDATCNRISNVVPGSGSFVITLNAGCTAETSIGFLVTN